MPSPTRPHHPPAPAPAAPVLVIGATGYIGGRLVPRLLRAGHAVRVLVRTPRKLSGRAWAGHPALEVVAGDVLDRATLSAAARGCRAAYYLVHSMNPQVADFAATDRAAAENMVAAARDAGLERIIYLSGLGEEGPGLSHHLRSRSEVGRILRSGPVAVTVLRAAMIIGSGSASFEILRYLVDRLPLMITPRWVDTPCQPIGVRNVLDYLLGCLDHPGARGETFDIGAADVVTYRELMRIYAEEAGLRRRWILPVPVLTPRLSSLWIHLVTPCPAALARPLTEGLRNPVICRDSRIRALLPQRLLTSREAIRLALDRLQQQEVESAWHDAGPLPPAEWSQPGDPGWAGGTLYTDARSILLAASPEQIWPAVTSLGGARGWYYADWLWRLRGWLDRLAGGVGLARGRRSSNELRPGDALDFWRVLALDPPRRLLLGAEMKLPGRAVLEFRLTPTAAGGTELRQSARFLPRGLAGILYWYAVAPFHQLVFSGLLRGIARGAAARVLAGPERLKSAD